jgi:hypothetical protein
LWPLSQRIPRALCRPALRGFRSRPKANSTPKYRNCPHLSVVSGRVQVTETFRGYGPIGKRRDGREILCLEK